jgi:glycosyltransferase involved in cell wall biosynthesis
MKDSAIPVSICVPTYNGAEYLQVCLNSILRQSFTDFEVIIVDDCSTDQSLQISKEYQQKDHRIKVFQNNNNLGLVENWNRCVDLAEGEWIKFVFQDDTLEPDCIKKMYNAAILGNGIVGCRRNIKFENVDPKIQIGFQKYLTWMSMDSIFEGLHDISALQFCNAVIENMGYNFIGEPTAVMIKKTMFTQYGKFNANFEQLCDFELFSRIACNRGIMYVPETLATFRIHNQGTSLKNKQENNYRAVTIDALLLFHEYATHPYYAHLRKVALQHRPPINFKLLSAMHHIRENVAIKLKTLILPERYPSERVELDHYFNHFPLAFPSKRYNWIKFFLPFMIYPWMTRNLYRHVLMKIDRIKHKEITSEKTPQ